MGSWLLDFSVNLGVCSPVKAKLLGLLDGLGTVKARGYSNLIIHMNSQLVVNKMKVEVLLSHAYYFIIEEFKLLELDSENFPLL